MPNRQTLRRHAKLIDEMATKLGIDLEESALRGEASVTDIEEAVLRCTACAIPETCEARLTTPFATMPQAPDQCRNTAFFDRLRLT